MWTDRVDALPNVRGLRLSFCCAGHPASFADVLQAWQTDEEFRAPFDSRLAQVPYAAFRWETPPLTQGTMRQPFECVILDSPELVRSSDPGAFAAHFSGEPSEVAIFPNLGGDALLIVPCPRADASVYAHLAAFVRGAPESQRREFWRAVAAATLRRAAVAPVWLSAAGDGVPWLHARLDERPKHYRHAPYRTL